MKTPLPRMPGPPSDSRGAGESGGSVNGADIAGGRSPSVVAPRAGGRPASDSPRGAGVIRPSDGPPIESIGADIIEARRAAASRAASIGCDLKSRPQVWQTCGQPTIRLPQEGHRPGGAMTTNAAAAGPSTAPNSPQTIQGRARCRASQLARGAKTTTQMTSTTIRSESPDTIPPRQNGGNGRRRRCETPHARLACRDVPLQCGGGNLV
jgi:hypothetical protein